MSVTRRRYLFLTTYDIEGAVYALASEFYPGYPDPMPAFQLLGGDHGRGLLESALAGPQQQFAGRYLYRTIYDKAAALFRSLVLNHALVDGNKRLALTSLAVFLTMNGYLFCVPTEEAVAFALRVAQTEGGLPIREISAWLRRYSISIRRLRARETESVERFERWLGSRGDAAPVLRELIRTIPQLYEVQVS